MANYAQLKAAVDQYIKTNGNNEITGAILNDVLNTIITSLGTNYQFAGVATPSMNPQTPDQNVVYFASEAGTYTNFNNIELQDGLSLLMWDGSWKAQTILDDTTNPLLTGHLVVKVPVTAGQDFRYDFDATDVESNVVTFTFTGREYINPNYPVAVYNSSSPYPVLNIMQDGTYSVNINQAYNKITFFRNGSYVTGTGTITIDIVIGDGLIDKVDKVDTDVYGEKVSEKIAVTASNDFRKEISTDDIVGEYFVFDFKGINLFNVPTYPVAVYNSSSSYPVLSIIADGTYSVKINRDFGKIIFFRNGSYVTGTGTVMISYLKQNGLKGKDYAKAENILYLDESLNYNTTSEQDDEAITMHQDVAGSMSVTVFRKLVGGIDYTLKIKAKCMSGTQLMRVGYFSSAGSDYIYYEDILLTTKKQEYVINIKGHAPSSLMSFGILSANAHQGVDVMIYGCWIVNETPAVTPITFNTGSFLQSVSKMDKPLIRIACAGDSLIANAVGGSIPSELDEGNTARPIRMDTNNIPRRLYDYMSWNKPVWRRLDNSDWTKSGFSLASWGSNGTVFEGMQVPYHTASASGSYCEITVPQGYENFAIVVRTKSGNGKLNVTINGSNPSAITYTNPVLVDNPAISQAELVQMLNGNSVVTTAVCPTTIPCGGTQIDLNKGVSATGNPYAVIEYNNLPSGQANVIRFTANSDDEVDVWGGFYWSGKTMVIMNIAHGGHDTSMLISQHLEDELYNAGYDAVLFEVPEMNNCRLELRQIEIDMLSIISRLRDININRCFTSCNPLGLSIKYDTNFWETETVSKMDDGNELVKKVLINCGEAFVDLFQYFRWHIENRGGTLEGGEGGLWYTWDGQHPNIEGCTLWVDALKKVIENTPIMIE